MKIAYLANIRFPSERAHAVQIAHMCKAFAEVGADVTLFVNQRSQASIQETEAHFQTQLPFAMKRISHGVFAPNIRISYYISEMFFALTFLLGHSPGQFDVIYTRHEWITWTLSLFIPKHKLAWESHEAKLTFAARQILKRKIKTIVISEGIYDAYLAYGCDAKQLLVAHDGIDESFFSVVESKQVARQRLGLPQEKQIAMYIGGFEGWKGAETFFAGAALCPDVIFVAIGGSENQIKQYKALYPAVTFLGSRPYFQLKDNQQAGDILVIPNSAKSELSAKFTSPLKLFAHMTSGVPLLISNVASLGVVLKDCTTIFEADDSNSLAKKLVGVLTNKELVNKNALVLREKSQIYLWKERALHIINFVK